MTKKTITRILPTVFAVFAIITSCANEYKDMNPGEVRLRENDYRNDDRLQPVTVTAEPDAEGAENIQQQLSSLEMRTLWHSVVINAEKLLESNTENETNTYASPMEAEEAFFRYMAQSMAVLQEKYPQQYQAVKEEFQRADVHVFAHYMWCTQSDEYVKLKFRATPAIGPDTTPVEEPDTPQAE